MTSVIPPRSNTMARCWTRREFVGQAAGLGLGAVAGGLGVSGRGRLAVAAETEPPRAPDTALTVIRGTPRERGRQYGRASQAAIEAFLDREIYGAFIKPKEATKDAMLR